MDKDMAPTQAIPKYHRIEELLLNSVPCDVFKKAKEAMEEEARQCLIDVSTLRKNQAWGIIANQVVGGERNER
jgi:hypothetical protein